MLVFNIILFLFYFNLTNAAETVADDYCKINGILQCLNKCQQLEKCVAHTENSIATCDHRSKFCNILHAKCVEANQRAAPGTCVINAADDIFTDDDIPCEYFINVPHPTDCTKYYTCEDGVRQLHPCPEGKAYDPATGACHLELSNDVCKVGLTPECEDTIIATSGPVTSYPRLYWFCTTYQVNFIFIFAYYY